MSIEENKAIVRRGFEEIWNQGKLNVVDEICSSDLVFYDMREDHHGSKGLKRYVSSVRTAFPDAHWEIKFQIAERDRVVTRWVWRGTHQGEIRIAGIATAPTGKQVTLEGASIERIVDGKIREIWVFRHRLAPALGFKSVPPQERAEG